MDRKQAEVLGIEALGWLAGQQEALERFLGASGMDAPDLRAAAGSPETACAVLDFLMADEALMLEFCETAACPPQALHKARYLLDPAACA